MFLGRCSFSKRLFSWCREIGCCFDCHLSPQRASGTRPAPFPFPRFYEGAHDDAGILTLMRSSSVRSLFSACRPSDLHQRWARARSRDSGEREGTGGVRRACQTDVSAYACYSVTYLAARCGCRVSVRRQQSVGVFCCSGSCAHLVCAAIVRTRSRCRDRAQASKQCSRLSRLAARTRQECASRCPPHTHRDTPIEIELYDITYNKSS